MAFIKNISSPASDDDLVVQYKSTGDMKLLSDLYQRYMDLVYGVCLKYFKEPEKSKDAVMDIYIELTSKLNHYTVENFRGWLHVLARNYCLMQLRTPKNLKTSEFKPEVVQSEQISHLENEVLENEENFKKLQQCIDQLPPEQLQTINLFFLEKKCYNEIAAITGFEWNKVRSYIQNGKRNLKICMDQKINNA